ncbi:MAG: hypothetical protein KKC46_18855 [Proteobacteria bacterium]|nr:hypothetical protein [Pseudomonadota bacterium]
MSKRRWGEAVLCMFVVLIMVGSFSSNAAAQMSTGFHGFFESSFVLRDTTGIQNGFFDQAEGVQQRNTLKFDIDVDPNMSWGPIAVQKIHLTFRGAYDSIFDLRANEYDIKDNMGASRFDYGLEDIRFEADLREAFIDISYKGPLGRGFFRPGRQIVSWGEGMLETLNDVINPPDNSFNLFFQNPDDVKTPLWMGRLNYSLPSTMTNLALNFDFLLIPDIRPTQFGPLDTLANSTSEGQLEAPYAKILPFADNRGVTKFRYDVPTDNNEYGAKVSAQIGDRLNLSFVYFRDVVNEPGVVMKDYKVGAIPVFPLSLQPTPTTASLTYNKQHVYGGFFSYQLLMFGMEAIVRGEVSHYTAYPISLPRSEYITEKNAAGFPVAQYTFEYRPVTKTMLAIDKDLRLRWLSKDLTKVSVEWIHKTINEWDNYLGESHYSPYYEGTTLYWDNNNVMGTNASHRNKMLRYDRRNMREQDVFMLQIMTYWWASKLNPMLIVAVNPGKHGEGTTYMIKPSIKWYITSTLYTDLKMQAFLGDKDACYGFADGIETSEVTLKLGYEW